MSFQSQIINVLTGAGRQLFRATFLATDENNNQNVVIPTQSIADPGSTAIAAVKAGSTLAASTDGALVVTLREGVTISGSLSLPTGAALEGGNLAAVASAAGSAADAAYGGSGSASLVAVLKGIYARFGGTLSVQTQTPSTFFNKRVLMTGSPINLPSNVLVNGIIGTTPSSNSGTIYYKSSTFSAIDGSDDAYPIAPGGSVSESLNNSNAVWVNGAAGNVIYFKGN
jgi:hypothetical protein